jgi:hypothetical protein
MNRFKREQYRRRIKFVLPPTGWLTPKQAAAFLGISYDRVLVLCRKEKLASVKRPSLSPPRQRANYLWPWSDLLHSSPYTHWWISQRSCAERKREKEKPDSERKLRGA